MRSINPYLIFDGNCREAMEFYAGALDAPVHIMSARDMPDCPAGQEDKVLHARLGAGSVTLMGSDNMGSTPWTQGNTVWVSVDCASAEEQSRMFDGLREGGTVTMELQDTFWGARFGMLTDRFGVHWMFNHDKGAGEA